MKGLEKLALVGAGIVVALVWLAVSWHAGGRSEELYGRRKDELARTIELADQLRQATRMQSILGEQAASGEVEQAFLEECASGSGVDPKKSIKSIIPGLPKQLGDTPYYEKNTTLELTSVDLKQLVTFLHKVIEQRPSLKLKSIRLVVEARLTDRWAATVTITAVARAKTPGY